MIDIENIYIYKENFNCKDAIVIVYKLGQIIYITLINIIESMI